MADQNAKLTLNVNLINVILRYLYTKPYVEVSGIVNALLKELEGQKIDTTKEDDSKLKEKEKYTG